MTLLTWLLTAEAIVLAGTVLGFLATLITGQPGYTLFPLGYRDWETDRKSVV